MSEGVTTEKLPNKKERVATRDTDACAYYRAYGTIPSWHSTASRLSQGGSQHSISLLLTGARSERYLSEDAGSPSFVLRVNPESPDLFSYLDVHIPHDRSEPVSQEQTATDVQKYVQYQYLFESGTVSYLRDGVRYDPVLADIDTNTHLSAPLASKRAT